MDKQNKHEEEVNELKAELEKYKALREEVDKRHKAEDMLKTIQIINQIEKEDSEPVLEVCTECDFTCKTKAEIKRHAENHKGKPAEKGAEKPAEKPSQKPSQKPAGKNKQAEKTQKNGNL